MTSMVERVALAMWRKREETFPKFTQRKTPDDIDFASGAWSAMLEQARAAIEAMRADQPKCEPMHPDEEGWSEWIHPLPGYLMQCCDCGLIHDMEFAIGETIEKGGPFNEGEDENGVIVFRARRASLLPPQSEE